MIPNPRIYKSRLTRAWSHEKEFNVGPPLFLLRIVRRDNHNNNFRDSVITVMGGPRRVTSIYTQNDRSGARTGTVVSNQR